jgi:hypothetical protein
MGDTYHYIRRYYSCTPVNNNNLKINLYVPALSAEQCSSVNAQDKHENTVLLGPIFDFDRHKQTVIYSIVIVRRCLERNFLSNPRRIHSGKEDKEKEEQGLPGALICCSPASPPSPPFLPHTARLLHCLGLCYQDIPPPPP